ncbi:MAG: NmrA family NAD(P)-binding protein [Myxococcales bacterium]|nr:NmrA family NAD(P)-binding protein [Myxococcales bacterium]MDP3505873.1 NmrA family NAD(P)-binding protein [Myxococcales bacterium]
MFAIAGVSGHTGAVVADTLLSKGQKVRVIVRTAEKGVAWQKKGAEVAVADLGDVAALTKALTGATGAYLLSPPNFAAADFIADRTALIGTMAKAITASGLKSLVFLSSVAAQHPAGTGPIVTVHRAEQAFGTLAPSVTFIRAAYFLENYGSVIPVAKAQGVLPNFGPVDVKFPQVCTKDIGEAVVQALLTPADGLRVVELAGKEDWSVQDVAAALSSLLGKPVQAVAAPVEAAKAGLMQNGVPESMATLYAEMYAGMGKGLIMFEKPGSISRGTTPLVDALRPLV